MSLPVTVYRWDDPGAPQLVYGLSSEILTVIRQCLIEGYGDKSALGWEEVLSDGTGIPRAIFKNNMLDGGSGGYLVLTPYTAGLDDDQGMYIQSATAFSDFDNLFNTGFKQGIRVFGATASYPNTEWLLIGNSTGFYFITGYLGSYSTTDYRCVCSFFAGDLLGTLVNDQGRFCAVAAFNAQNYNPPSTNTAGYGLNLDYINRVTASDLSEDGILLIDVDGGSFQHRYIVNRCRSEVTSTLDGGALDNNLLTPLFLTASSDNDNTDRDGLSFYQSSTRPYYRGYLPGFYMAEMPFSKALLWPAIIRYDEDEYLLLRNPEKNRPSIALIKLGPWV